MDDKSINDHTDSAKMFDKKVCVLVDMDGVLCDFDAGFLQRFRQMHPDLPFIPLDERNSVYVEEQYMEMFGASVDARSIVEEKDFFLNLPKIEGALKGMLSLAGRDDVNLFICTSPLRKFENCVLEKYRWVSNNLGKKFTEKIILTRDKSVVNGHFLIDDKPDISQQGSQVARWKHLLFTTHHNRHVIPENGQIKLSGWNDPVLHTVIDEKVKEINSYDAVS
ncbi:unnamed protein product [Clavelina lepadiformis]|uniref:Uncharacterized protein n=2 Tax=Clavelina lepadiformis TaxID=159417 RepID=A0ABP0G7W6_CLALP